MARTSLAVKYRPKTFDDLTEQGAIKDILEEQIKTKTFQHAYLFTGPAGTGKTTSARIFADMINQNKGNPIEVDAASNSGVDNIRHIIDDSKKKALDAEYKIYIIDECHSLSSGAWQAMLKLLEEPPKYSIFILCTTDPQKIPATIMSRVQRYQFNKISNSGIEDRLHTILHNELEVGGEVHPEAVSYIAKIANGGMRDAITMMDKCLSLSNHLTLDNVLKVVGSEDYSTFFKLLKGLCSRDLTCIEIIDNVFADGKDIKQFMKEFSKFILDCQKYAIFKNMDYLTIPATNEMEEELKSLDSDSTFSVMRTIMDINNQIKYDADPKTLVQMGLVLYCKEGV